MNARSDKPSPPPTGATDAGGDGMRRWQLLALAAAAFLLVGLLGQAAGCVAPESVALAATLAIIAGSAFIGISVAMVALIARLSLPWAEQLALALVLGGASAAWGLARVELLKDLFLFVAATFFGVFASRIIKERNMLVPIVVVAAAVDAWGVYYGFVAHVAKKAPEVVQHFSASIPGAEAVAMPVSLLSAIGIGDFLFMGLFVAAVYQLGMNGRATLWALFVAFLAAPVVFSLAGAAALPGLPFLGLAVLVANWRYFHFSRAERFALLYAAVAVVALVGAAWAIIKVLRV
jgi:hypothetical protein